MTSLSFMSVKEEQCCRLLPVCMRSLTLCVYGWKAQMTDCNGVASLIINKGWYILLHVIKTCSFHVLTEKLSHAKEENLDMNQMLEQTLMELNNLWTAWPLSTVVLAFFLLLFWFLFLHLAYDEPIFLCLTHSGELRARCYFHYTVLPWAGLVQGANLKRSKSFPLVRPWSVKHTFCKPVFIL